MDLEECSENYQESFMNAWKVGIAYYARLFLWLELVPVNHSASGPYLAGLWGGCHSFLATAHSKL